MLACSCDAALSSGGTSGEHEFHAPRCAHHQTASRSKPTTVSSVPVGSRRAYRTEPVFSGSNRDHVRRVRRRFRQLRQFGLLPGQQQSVAEVSSNGFLVSSSVFGTSGGSAFPGTLTTIGASANLPSPSSAGDILELQPNGQLFIFNPASRSSAAVRQPVQLHGQCVQRLRCSDGRVRRSEQPDQPGRGDLRRFRDFRPFARGVRRVEQLGLRDAADLRVVGRCCDRAGRFSGERRALGRTRGGRRRLAGHGPHDLALCAGGDLDGHSRARRVQPQLRLGKHARRRSSRRSA